MGSIPFGLILTKIFLKKDIREIGSGNIGATNALRTGNKLIGYSTLILDVLKAVVPVLLLLIHQVLVSNNQLVYYQFLKHLLRQYYQNRFL